jgi:hypothetical protein
MGEITDHTIVLHNRTCIDDRVTADACPRLHHCPRPNEGTLADLDRAEDESVRADDTLPCARANVADHLATTGVVADSGMSRSGMESQDLVAAQDLGAIQPITGH